MKSVSYSIADTLLWATEAREINSKVSNHLVVPGLVYFSSLETESGLLKDGLDFYTSSTPHAQVTQTEVWKALIHTVINPPGVGPRAHQHFTFPQGNLEV